VGDPNLVKEILTSHNSYYRLPTHPKAKDAFFGKGLVPMNGKDWVLHRGIMDHAFCHDTFKV
jgi:cytochrome P450